MSTVDYKQKYKELRNNFISECDRYYRMGYESGMKEGAQQAQMEAMQQQQQMMAQAQQPQVDPETGEPIMPEEGGMPPEMEQGMPEEGGMPPEMEQGMPMDEQQGSELDAAIEELSNLVQKGEKPKITDLRKTVSELLDIRKSHKLKSNHKEVTVSAQKKLVDSMLEKWEKDANKTVNDNLEEIIEKEGFEIKE